MIYRETLVTIPGQMTVWNISECLASGRLVRIELSCLFLLIVINARCVFSARLKHQVINIHTPRMPGTVTTCPVKDKARTNPRY